MIQDRYSNKRLIVKSHMQAILNSPEIGKCTTESLRKLIDDTTANLEALKVMGIPINESDVFVNAIILSKLDYHARKEFEDTLDTETPTREELITFLTKKCTTMEAMKQDARHKPPTAPSQSSYPPRLSNKKRCLKTLNERRKVHLQPI